MPVLISPIARIVGVDARRVLGLDDALDVAVGVADDAAVGAGVVELDGHHGRAGVGGAVRLEQRGDDLGVDQRVVAGEDDDGVGVADDVVRGAHGAAGAVGLGLDDGLGALGQARGEVAVGRDDHDDALGAGLARGEHRPGDHRPPADGMQHLRQRRVHPRALARGHDQDGGPAHVANRRGEAPRDGLREVRLAGYIRPRRRPAPNPHSGAHAAGRGGQRGPRALGTPVIASPPRWAP